MSTPMVFTAYVDSTEMGGQVRTRLLELCGASDVTAEIRVVNVLAEPAAAEASNVVGIPMVVREQPHPRRRVIGALEDARRVAEALGLNDRPSDIEPSDIDGDEPTDAGVVDERA